MKYLRHAFACPSCRAPMACDNTRPTEEGWVRRGRKCPACARRIHTLEVPEAHLLAQTDLRSSLLHYADSITRIATHIRENVK